MGQPIMWTQKNSSQQPLGKAQRITCNITIAMDLPNELDFTSFWFCFVPGVILNPQKL